VIVLVLALVYAELGAAYPVTDGTSRIPHIAFGPIAGFASGWLAWLGSVTLAPIEVEAALQYLTPKVHAFALMQQNGSAVVLIAAGFGVGVVLLLLFAVINVLGVPRLRSTSIHCLTRCRRCNDPLTPVNTPVGQSVAAT
jgi:amino acid transporter